MLLDFMRYDDMKPNHISWVSFSFTFSLVRLNIFFPCSLLLSSFCLTHDRRRDAYQLTSHAFPAVPLEIFFYLLMI